MKNRGFPALQADFRRNVIIEREKSDMFLGKGLAKMKRCTKRNVEEIRKKTPFSQKYERIFRVTLVYKTANYSYKYYISGNTYVIPTMEP
jgi:hypothetical protein